MKHYNLQRELPWSFEPNQNGQNEYPREDRKPVQVYGKFMKPEVSNQFLTKDGLRQGLIMGEILGPPRSISPYFSPRFHHKP